MCYNSLTMWTNLTISTPYGPHGHTTRPGYCMHRDNIYYSKTMQLRQVKFGCAKHTFIYVKKMYGAKNS